MGGGGRGENGGEGEGKVGTPSLGRFSEGHALYDRYHSDCLRRSICLHVIFEG